MGRILAFLGRYGTQSLFLGVFVGLALPDLAALCRPLLAPAVALMLFAAALRVDLAAMLLQLRRPVRLLVLLVWLQLGAPLLVWCLFTLLDLPTALEAAIVLMAAAPPLVGAVSIAFLLGLDGALALVACLTATLLVPLTVPLLALTLLGLELNIDATAFLARLAFLVGAAYLGAAVIRRLARPGWIEAQSQRIDGLTVIIMVIFAVAVMDEVNLALTTRPETVALWLAASFVANPLLQGLGWIAFRGRRLRPALTVGLISGNRNMGLLLAALPAGADPDVALYFAIAQLPMYMLPAIVLPFYRRSLARADLDEDKA